MPYCRNCGTKLPDDASYCSKCGTQIFEIKAIPELANWGERFAAWLIDIILLGVFLSPIKLVVSLQWPSFIWAPTFLRWIPLIDFGLDNVIYFLYWTLMEGIYGQSIGKMVMKIKVTRLNGKRADFIQTLIGSVGKAFLLPVDCVLGWILYAPRNQRLFNYISETIITKTSRNYR